MDKADERLVNSLLNLEDSLKSLLFNCTTKRQEKQVREKLSKVNDELKHIYIN